MKRSILGFTVLALALASVQATAGMSASADCLQKLSQGTNRMKAKVNLGALQALAKAREKFSSQISEKDTALLIDYSVNSKQKRAYMVDFKSCDILSAEHVLHGGTTYKDPATGKPKLDRQGDPEHDGLLDKCINRDGNRTNMTRPGAMVTSGCHMTGENGWTILANKCNGVKLRGLESRNSDVMDAHVVLHEHKLMPDNNSVKPEGQGCPAFPVDKLASVFKFGSDKGMLVYLYTPQCK